MAKNKNSGSRSPHTDDIENIVNDVLDCLFKKNTPSYNSKKAKSKDESDSPENIFNDPSQEIKDNAKFLLNVMKLAESGLKPKNKNGKAKNSNPKAEEDIGQKNFEDSVKAYSNTLLKYQAVGESIAIDFLEKLKSAADGESSTTAADGESSTNEPDDFNNHHHSYYHNQQDH